MPKKKKSPSSKPQKSSEKEDDRFVLSDDEELPTESLSDQAKSLYDAMKSGQFDGLVSKYKKHADEDSIEEVVLGDDNEDGEDDSNSDEHSVQENESSRSEEESVEGSEDGESEEESIEESEDGEEDDNGRKLSDKALPDAEKAADSVDSPSDSESSEDDESSNKAGPKNEDAIDAEQDDGQDELSAKALKLITQEYKTSRKMMPWAETFDVSPRRPLPFGPNNKEGNPLDIHDDLKREVAFYDLALEAVIIAKRNCKDADIPFSRPEDFFAEMVKSDDHMARVKDRLIFETKKMSAVAQRKVNKEQKFRAKEVQANKLLEKAKRKREHFEALDDWAKKSASRRGSGKMDESFDREMLQSMERGRSKSASPNKKRLAADRKYGFGGKRGRFKQNDPKSLNDMSGFNPRGNFAGGGMKKSKKTGSSGGGNRPGKRARDAKRSGRN